MTAPQYQRSFVLRCASFGTSNLKRGTSANALAITRAAEGTSPARRVDTRISGMATN